MMDWGAMGGFMWVAMLIWTVLGIALVVLVIVGVVWLVRQLGRDGQGRRRPATRTAIEDLELRYARGEVDRETFLAIREDLERDGG
jgi:putative membrane protein